MSVFNKKKAATKWWWWPTPDGTIPVGWNGEAQKTLVFLLSSPKPHDQNEFYSCLHRDIYSSSGLNQTRGMPWWFQWIISAGQVATQKHWALFVFRLLRIRHNCASMLWLPKHVLQRQMAEMGNRFFSGLNPALQPEELQFHSGYDVSVVCTVSLVEMEKQKGLTWSGEFPFFENRSAASL